MRVIGLVVALTLILFAALAGEGQQTGTIRNRLGAHAVSRDAARGVGKR
jgi:hypothetical protein